MCTYMELSLRFSKRTNPFSPQSIQRTEWGLRANSHRANNCQMLTEFDSHQFPSYPNRIGIEIHPDYLNR